MLTGYFDNNATTPLAQEVISEMTAMLSLFGNPSSSHKFGAEAKKNLLKAKEQIADLLNCGTDELILTSGGTESNNLCIKGYLKALGNRGHVITSVIEHPSVLQVLKTLEAEQGIRVTYLPVNREGIVDLEDIRSAINSDTVLISIMMANNEIGSIQPIKEIAAIARKHNIFLHTDAVQAVGKIPIDVRELGVDALSLSGHKLNAPKGIGVLYVKKGWELQPLLHGGGQEKGIRGGTENVLAACGLGVACAVAKRDLASKTRDYRNLKQFFYLRVSEEMEDVSFNGGLDEDKFLLNTVNICIKGIRAEALACLLNEQYNIAVSLGSACSTNKAANLSHVLTAIGLTPADIRSAIRISFGKHHTMGDVDFLVDALKGKTALLRGFSAMPSEKPAAAAFTHHHSTKLSVIENA